MQLYSSCFYALENEGEQIPKEERKKEERKKKTCGKLLKTFLNKELSAAFHKLKHALQRCAVYCTDAFGSAALYIPLVRKRGGKFPLLHDRGEYLSSISPITHGLQRLLKHRGAAAARMSLRAPAAALPVSRTPR